MEEVMVEKSEKQKHSLKRKKSIKGKITIKCI